jgi:hypothetical protein
LPVSHPGGTFRSWLNSIKIALRKPQQRYFIREHPALALLSFVMLWIVIPAAGLSVAASVLRYVIKSHHGARNKK